MLTYLQLNDNFCKINVIFIHISASHLRNVYVANIQFLCYSDYKILSYKESARFTGTTLVFSEHQIVYRTTIFM